MNNRCSSSMFVGSAALFLASCAAVMGQAVWTNATGNGKVNDGGNWQGGSVPTSDVANTTLNFPLSGSQIVTFNGTDFQVNGLTFSASSNNTYTYLRNDTTQTLTIGAGGVTLTNQGFASFGLPLVIAANQTWSGANSIEVTGNISGPGNIIKTGAGNIYFNGATFSSFTGSLDIQQGSLCLGTDGLKVQAPVSLESGVSVKVIDTISWDSAGNLVVHPINTEIDGNTALFPNVTFLGDGTDRPCSLNFPRTVTLNPTAAAITTNVINGVTPRFQDVTSNTAGTAWTFTGNSSVLLVGSNASFLNNVSKLTSDGTRIAFATNTYLGNLPDHAGIEATSALGSAVSVQGTATTTDNGTLLSGVISKINPSAFNGFLSLDTDSGYSGTAEFAAGADLQTGFSSSNSPRIGSTSSALLSTTPLLPAGAPYRFGMGGGVLTVSAALSGSDGIDLDSTNSKPLTLILTGNNSTQTGNISVTSSLLVFNAACALPSSGSSVILGTDAYVGYTSATGLTPNDFISRLTWSNANAIIGFDASDLTSSTSLSGPIDFSSHTTTPFIGTQSQLQLQSCKVLTPGADKTLRFAALPGALMQIDAPLTSSATDVVFGYSSHLFDTTKLPVGRYQLSNTNTYSGSTVINSGTFDLASDAAFGTSTVNIASDAGTVTFLAKDNGYDSNNRTLANNIHADNTGLFLNYFGGYSSGSPLTLTGVISGSTALTVGNNVSLFGTNTYTGGTQVAGGATVYIGGTSPFGAASGAVTVQDAATLLLSNAAKTGSATVSLPNAVTLGQAVSIGTYLSGKSSLTFNGPVSLNLPDYSNKTYVGENTTVTFNSTLSPSANFIEWVVAAPEDSLGGKVVINGTIDPAITRITADGGEIIFSSNLPSNTVAAIDNGLIGITSPSLLAGVLGKITDKANFGGTLSLDTANTTPTTFTTDLDISGFTSSQFRIGSTSQAVLASVVTPAQNQAYAFGNGGGFLEVTAALNYSTSHPASVNPLMVDSTPGSTLAVELSHANDFGGADVTVSKSFLIFNAPGALPASSKVNADSVNSAYVSYTSLDTDYATFGSFFSKFQTAGVNQLVLGYDAPNPNATGASVTLPGNADFSSSADSIYLGTLTRLLTIPATAVLKAGDSDGLCTFGFAAFNGAKMDIQASLTGDDTAGVNYGIDYSPMNNWGAGPGTYVISGHNTYGGSTSIFGGSFELRSPTAFSKNDIYFKGVSGPNALYAGAGLKILIQNAIYANYSSQGELDLGSANAWLGISGYVQGTADIYVKGPLALLGGVCLSGNIYVNDADLTISNQVNSWNLFLSSGRRLQVQTSSDQGTQQALVSNLTLSSGAVLGLDSSGNSKGQLNINGDLNLATTSDGAVLSTPLDRNLTVYLSSDVYAQNANTTWSIENSGLASKRGGRLEITTGAYNDGKTTGIIANNSSVVFDMSTSSNSFAERLTSIQATNGGLIGIAASSSASATTNNGAVAFILNKITAPASFGGTLSLDTYYGSEGAGSAFFGGAGISLDLSAFSYSAFTLGSSTQAVILPGTSLVFSGSTYKFGGGKGTLIVESNLTGSKSLSLSSAFGDSQKLVLEGANTFTGSITVSNSLLVLDSSGALPASATIQLQSNGYASYTPNSSITSFSNFLSHISTSAGSTAVIGIDNGNGSANSESDYWQSQVQTSGAINLSAFSATPYIGTSTNARITADTTLTPGADNTLRFVALRGGSLIVDAKLADSGSALSVVYGHPSGSLVASDKSNYTVTNSNTYTGGTTIYNGSFSLTNSNAFGTGPISIVATSHPVQFFPGYQAFVTLGQNINLGTSANLSLGVPWITYNTDEDPSVSEKQWFTITGSITGGGSLTIDDGVTLSGNNTYAGGTTVNQGEVDISGTQPFGTGAVTLLQGASVYVNANTSLPASQVVTFDSDVSLSALNSSTRTTELSISGGAQAMTQDIVTHVNQGLKVIMNGLSGQYANTQWTFDHSDDYNMGGLVALTGTTTNVSDILASGTAVVFANPNSVPTLTIQSDSGIIGVAGDNTLLASVLNHITAKSDFRGALSLDSMTYGTTNVYGGNGVTIDLSGFDPSTFTLGSVSTAEIAAGTTIIPPGLGNYKFGSGGGRLIVSASLADGVNSGGAYATSLSLDSPEGLPLTLVLKGTNTFTGNISVTQSFLILDSAGAVPTGKKVTLNSSGYVGYTANAALPAPGNSGDIFSLLSGTPDTTGIVGFDTATPATTGVTFASGSSINLSAFSSSFYLGTTSKFLTFDSGSTITAAGDNNLKFAAFQGGTIDLAATLVPYGSNAQLQNVTYGHPDPGMANDLNTGLPGTYILRSAVNSLSTNIWNGQIQIANNQAFGVGTAGSPSTVTVEPNAGTVIISPYNNASITLGSGVSIQAYNEVLELGSANPSSTGSLTINGPISGYAKLLIAGNVTLGGSNCFSGGIAFNDSVVSVLTASSNSALGNGPLAMSMQDSLVLTSSAPVINDLSGQGSIFLANNSTLTIKQSDYLKVSTTFVGGTPGASSSTNAAVVYDGTNNGVTYLANSGSTYTGGTTIQGGTVVHYGSGSSFGTGTITLNGGTLQLMNPGANLTNTLAFTSTGNVLGGKGGYAGTSLTLDSSFTLRPGVQNFSDSGVTYVPTPMTFNTNLNFSTGGSLQLIVRDPSGTAGADYSMLSTTGTITFSGNNGSFVVSLLCVDSSGALTSPNPTGDQTYSLTIAHASSFVNFNPSMLTLDTSIFTSGVTPAWSFTLANSNTDLVLNFSPVPEPETWMMMLGGSAALLYPLVRRRRK